MKPLYLALAILIIVLLVVIFIITFVLYKKTPAPKGCENLTISEENCRNCPNSSCSNRKEEE